MFEEKTIVVAVKGQALIDIAELVPIQGELVELTDENKAKLKKEILETGFAFSPHVWMSPADGKVYILDGHQRIICLRELRAEGYYVPQIPVTYVEAATLEEAKARVLQARSQYGHMTERGLASFAVSANINLGQIQGRFDFPSIDMDKFKKIFAEVAKGTTLVSEHERETGGAGEDNPYTKKIEAPIYTPKGEKPHPAELLDRTKTDQLVAEIVKANLPEDIQNFLAAAAMRHIRFDYEKIAEFYSHAEPEVQDLFEKSALVIIDFDKAIENGFVKLAERIAEAYQDAIRAE